MTPLIKKEKKKFNTPETIKFIEKNKMKREKTTIKI